MEYTLCYNFLWRREIILFSLHWNLHASRLLKKTNLKSFHSILALGAFPTRRDTISVGLSQCSSTAETSGVTIYVQRWSDLAHSHSFCSFPEMNNGTMLNSGLKWRVFLAMVVSVSLQQWVLWGTFLRKLERGKKDIILPQHETEKKDFHL